MGNFFGMDDEWNSKKKQISFFDMNQVKLLFKDFEIMEINEKKYDVELKDNYKYEFHISKK